jgi:hypothetical protein
MLFSAPSFLLGRWVARFGDSGVVGIGIAEAKNLMLDIVDNFPDLHGLSSSLRALSDGKIIVSVVIAFFVVRTMKGHDPPSA